MQFPFCKEARGMSNSDEEEEEEEERLSQMIRDPGRVESFHFSIELDSPASISYSPSKSLKLDQNPTTYFSLQEILENVTATEAEILGKVLFYLREMEPNDLRKWIVMRLGMDYYEASLCRTSWITFSNRHSGDYEFIDVMMKDDNGGGPVRLIVDIDFRSQFELARPTPSYKELSNSLPSIFVGTQEKLEKIISLLCPAAKQSLREGGLHVPPWRKAGYMHSKWLSQSCKKISFTEMGTLLSEAISLSFLQF